MRPPQELLYESEASLRLVDKAIEDFRATSAELDGDTERLLRRVMAIATSDILDGLNRAALLVEKLDNGANLSDAERHEVAASLREELGGVSDQLQFEDMFGGRRARKPA